MLKHILVTLDSPKYAEYMLEHAQSVAQSTGAKITLLRMFDSTPKNRNNIVDPLDWHLRKMEIEASLSDATKNLSNKNLSVETAVLDSYNAEQLIQYIQSNQVDLMIMAKQSVNVGDLAYTIMKRTATPVVILPVRDFLIKDVRAFECYRTILLPLDGSQRAEITLPIASELAQKCDAELILTHIVHKPEIPRHAPPNAEETMLVDRIVELNRTEAVRYLEEVAARLPGHKQTRVIVSDNAVTSLHRLADQENVDIIILSAHGYSGEPDWPYGSVTSHLITHSTRPVLVVQDIPTSKPQRNEQPEVARSGSAR